MMKEIQRPFPDLPAGLLVLVENNEDVNVSDLPVGWEDMFTTYLNEVVKFVYCQMEGDPDVDAVKRLLVTVCHASGTLSRLNVLGKYSIWGAHDFACALGVAIAPELADVENIGEWAKEFDAGLMVRA